MGLLCHIVCQHMPSIIYRCSHFSPGLIMAWAEWGEQEKNMGTKVELSWATTWLLSFAHCLSLALDPLSSRNCTIPIFHPHDFWWLHFSLRSMCLPYELAGPLQILKKLKPKETHRTAEGIKRIKDQDWRTMIGCSDKKHKSVFFFQSPPRGHQRAKNFFLSKRMW